MNKKRMTGFQGLRLLGLSFVFMLLLVQPGYGAEKDLVIKIATLAPEGSSWMKTFNQLNNEVMKKTESKVRFKVYPGGVLGDEMDMLRKMRIGQIQGTYLTSGGLSVLFKETDVLQVPFLFQKYDEADALMTRMDPFFRNGFEDNGYVVLGWSEAGFAYLMSTVPVSGVSDLKKAKVWVWEDSSMAKVIFDEAGVKAIPLSLPDVLVALQTGMVEVVYTPPTGAISLQWFTKIKYITDVPLAYVAGGIVVRKDTFRQIPLPTQNIILESFRVHLDQLKGVIRNENKEAMKVMMKQGVKLVTPSKEQLDEFKRLSSRAMSRPGSQSFSKKTLEEASSFLEGYRKGGR